MPASNPRYQVSRLERVNTSLKIVWQDEHVSCYPAIWLLEACDCAQCGDTQTAVRHVKLTDKPIHPQPGHCSHDDSSLSVDWGGAHLSSYNLTWLRTMCLSEKARRERKFRPILWGSEMANALPYMDYAEVKVSSESHQVFLESILYRGFAILRGVPAAREQSEEIASLVGRLRLTNYEVYELESKPDPEIVADTALPLAPHTDEPYRIDPPAITFFHVIQASKHGGASTLIDSFKLVEALKQQNSTAFEILSTVPARFHRNLREGRRFEYQHPIIQIDSDGDITSVRLLDRGMAPVDCAVDQVQPFYDALHEFLQLSYGGKGMIEFKPHSGEVLVFNNQRLMHGRTAFDPSESKRHIRSFSVDLDEFYSRLRIIYDERQDPRRWMTFRKD